MSEVLLWSVRMAVLEVSSDLEAMGLASIFKIELSVEIESGVWSGFNFLLYFFPTPLLPAQL
jgi:hypothetical protein